METVVVGVDGSACASAALEFAAREAALRGARLRIISAWEIAPMIGSVGIYPAEALCGLKEQAESAVQGALARAAELQPTVPTEGTVVEGQPAHMLINEAQGAALLVVGSTMLPVRSPSFGSLGANPKPRARRDQARKPRGAGKLDRRSRRPAG